MSNCCTHSYCTVYTDHPSGRCPGHRDYIVFRQATPDAPREYYLGSNRWSDDRTQARRFMGSAASSLCENLAFHGHGMTFLFEAAE